MFVCLFFCINTPVMVRSKWILGTLVLIVLLFPALFTLAVRANEGGVTVEDEPAEEADADAAGAGATEAGAGGFNTDDMGALDTGLYSAADVEYACLFPDFPDRKFPLGKTIDVLLGFANRGSKSYTVDVVAGYLVSPLDVNFHIQNFTAFAYNVTVKADEESSIRYRFRTDPRLDPREYGVRIDVFYRNELNRTFATSFFNETVQLLDVSSGFDPRSFFGYVAITGVFGLIGFLVYKLIQGKVDKSKKKPVAQPTADQPTAAQVKDVDWDWIPKGHSAHLRKKKVNSNKAETSQARQYQSD